MTNTKYLDEKTEGTESIGISADDHMTLQLLYKDGNIVFECRS